MLRQKSRPSEVLASARRNSRKEESFRQGGFEFLSATDHILESQCSHAATDEAAGGDGPDPDCLRCLFESSLSLPEYPEMVFPQNQLSVAFSSHAGSSISFNALDALKQVCADRLPDVQVAPSAVWQQARRGIMSECNGKAHPFDWTYTTNYAGTLKGCKAIPSDDVIDLERLKRQEAIGFYSQVTLYEDELADHGSAEMSVRIRVMPTFFFILMRFYLRVDNVLVRVCDTRVVGDNGSGYVVREWSRREAKMDDLQHVPKSVLLDANQVWPHLPVVQSTVERIVPE